MNVNQKESEKFLKLVTDFFPNYAEITFCMNVIQNENPNKVLVRNKSEEIDITSLFLDNISGENIKAKFQFFSKQACNKEIDLNSNTGVIMMITFEQMLSKSYPIEPMLIMHDYSEKNTNIMTEKNILEVDNSNNKKMNKKM